MTELLLRPDVRALTLTGSGGTGKTRLALQVAGNAADAYPDGVRWIPLAPVRDPLAVLAAAAGALGASGDLASVIADSRMLLLFDNFEHLITAADELGRLVASCRTCARRSTGRPLPMSSSAFDSRSRSRTSG